MLDTILNWLTALVVSLVFWGCIILMIIGDFQ